MKILIVVVLVISIIYIKVNAAPSLVNLVQAKRLYERMTGVKVSSVNPDLQKVAIFLEEGKIKEAVEYITKTSNFLNVQIKNFAIRLSNKDQSVKVPFNDFAAIVVGVVRDDKDFREILTADYYYDFNGVPQSDDQRTRFFNQNNFSAAEVNLMDFQSSLVFHPKQKMVEWAWDTLYSQTQKSNIPLVTLKEQPDPAGVLTTRTFAQANLSGGTNRRPVDFSLKQFLCVSPAELADSSTSDQFVGRDVERFPSGDYNKYLNTCKGCHSILDGMRGAFAKSEFSNFSNGLSVSIFSQMHGDFYRNHHIDDALNKFLINDFNQLKLNPIVTEIPEKQKSSTWYTTRLSYLKRVGIKEETALAQVNAMLDKVRDPKVLNNILSSFQINNRVFLADINANKTVSAYIQKYTQACLNHFANISISLQEQERRFLVCELNSKRVDSLLYAYYEKYLVSQKIIETEKVRLLKKFINLNYRDIEFVSSYLQAIDHSKLFSKSTFNSDTGVTEKMNKGSYPYGFVVNDDSFVNNANSVENSKLLGWRGNNKNGGRGVKEFGRMISDSSRFSQCMAKQVFEQMCLKTSDSPISSKDMVRFANIFEMKKYDLKDLYQQIAMDPSCGILGEN